MFKRMILMLVAAVLLISVLGFVKFRQIQAATQSQSMMQMPPTAVTTIVAQREVWPATLDVIGTMEAVQGVTVSADLPGSVERINFDSGKQVHQGDVLVELDTRQERAQLADVMRSAPPFSGRRSGRRSPECWASARSTSDSICQPAILWFRCRR